jgi:hypothetical protein
MEEVMTILKLGVLAGIMVIALYAATTWHNHLPKKTRRYRRRRNGGRDG